VAVVLLLPIGSVLRAEQDAPVPGKAATCAACHPAAAQSWAKSLHRRTVGAPQIREEWQGCEACHYGAQEHMADISDVSKRPTLNKLTADEVTAICQKCHRGGQQALWDLSSHARTKDACLGCHDPHSGVGEHMLKAEEPEICQQCHPDVVADTRLPYHHPIQEGKMVCTDCHNVHGEQRGNLTEASNGEMCFKCHAEKAGPFMAEHPPVTEDCTICHRPHGSPVPSLLVQDQPMLCLQCHTGHSDSHRTPLVGTSPNNPDTLKAIGGFYNRCTSCHSRIHGNDLLSQTGNPTFMPGSPLEPLGEHAGDRPFSITDKSMWGFADLDLTTLSEDKNQTFVRQYDGRDYGIPTSRLSVLRFGENDDLRFETSDLPIGDSEIKLRMGNPRYDLKVRESGLTHRLRRFDEVLNVNIPAGSGGTNQLFTTDLTNGKQDFQLGRTLIDVRLAARCPRIPNAKWLLNYWQEAESGTQQFLFLDRCAGCHKVQTAEPIDRVTTITTEGVQVDFPKASVRYLAGQEQFSNRADDGFFQFSGSFASIFNGLAPLFGVANTHTNTNDLRVSGALGKRTSAAALYRTKDRNDLLGGGKIDIRSLGGGLNHALSRTLRLQASHFQRDLDVNNSTEEGVSRGRDTTRVDLRWTGLPHTVWSLGYQKEIVDRHAEREVPPKSDSSIWSTALHYQPASRLSLRVRYRKTTTDNKDILDLETLGTSSRLIGLPNDGKLLSAVLGYTFNPNTLLTAMYSNRDDKFSVAGPTSFRADEQKARTEGAQLTHSRKRGQVGVGYYRQTGDTGANTTYGTDAFTLSPPLSAAPIDFPPINSSDAFHYRATILTTDGSWWLTSRVRLFGRYNRTKTNGQETLFDLGDYIDNNPDLNGVNLVLNPFDVTATDSWFGAGYLMNRETEFVMSHQRGSWTDSANPTHDGTYTVWRVGVRKQF
jgi:DmsE family decaheme c-type cytochrome